MPGRSTASPRRPTLSPDEQDPSKRQRFDTQDKGKGKNKGGKGNKGSKGQHKGQYRPSRPSLADMGPLGSWESGYTSGFGGQTNNPWNQTQNLQTSLDFDPEWMTQKVNTLTQLVLRQEQTITSLRQDTVVYLFVRSGPDGMVPVMCEAADKWRTMKTETPEKLTYSLKLTMFKQLLISLHQRLTETAKDDAAMERAKALNWVDEQKNWRHLHWNPAQQRLEIDNGLRPISTEDLLAQLVQMRKAVTEDTLLRFKSVKRLTTEVTAEWIQFQIIISLRQEGGPIWSTLNQWIGQASWHTLGCRLRRDRPAYDNLTQQIWNQL
eukprot:s6324_g1.t1